MKTTLALFSKMSKPDLSTTPSALPPRKAVMPKILFLADSRGRNLEIDLRDLLGNTFTLMCYPGATVMDTLRRSEYLRKNNHWTQIYCLAGLCDLTIKNHSSRIVSIRNPDTGHLVRDYVNTLHEAYTTLIHQCPRADSLKCVFCPVTGLNFSAYNKRSSHPDDALNQRILNEAIVQLNTEIVDFNSSNKNFTPWTNRTVHRRHRQTMSHNYERLASDGCHLSIPVRHHWAETLHEAVVKNQ